MLEPVKHKLNGLDIILASASPRRSELLTKMGLKFQMYSSNFNERLIEANECSDFREYCRKMADNKADAVVNEFTDCNRHVDLIISADTIVVLDNKIFNKPTSDDDAVQMLTLLSGKKHKVITAVCFLFVDACHSRRRDTFFEETTVHFGNLSADIIKGYVATGEPLDKAGGYGIQGIGASLIEGIEGDYYNVMGFPVFRVCAKLVEHYANKDLIS